MRQEAVRTAVSRFVELPTTQRSAVILKDVLDHSLAEIAALLDLSIDAVKAHLARGRANLREINARAADPAAARPASAAAVRYAALFNARRLGRAARPPGGRRPARAGLEAAPGRRRRCRGLLHRLRANEDVRLVPAWTEGREVFAVFAGSDANAPATWCWSSGAASRSASSATITTPATWSRARRSSLPRRGRRETSRGLPSLGAP